MHVAWAIWHTGKRLPSGKSIWMNLSTCDYDNFLCQMLMHLDPCLVQQTLEHTTVSTSAGMCT